MRKKTLIANILFCLSLGGAAQVQAERVVNFAHSLSDESHFSVGVDAFKATLENLSNGEFKVTEYSAGALGGERTLIEGLQIGTVDAILTSTGPLGNFVPQTYVFDLPFLFADYKEARCVLDGKVGDDVLDMISKHGVKAMAWSESGFRNITNSVKPLITPEDFSGAKIRTMENEIHMDTFRALGANPTPVAFPELFTALQQGTVDGQENPISVIVSSRFSEVQKNLSLTKHVYTAGVLMLSNSLYASLSDEEKSWFEQATKASIIATRDQISLMEVDGLALLKEQGVKIEDSIDRAALKEKVKVVYDHFSEEYGSDLLTQIRNSGC